MGPLNPRMKKELTEARQIDIHYPVDWTTLGEYLSKLETRGVSTNVASFVGATTVRTHVLGERDVQPTAGRTRRDAQPRRDGHGGRRAGRGLVAHLRAGLLRQDRRADGAVHRGRPLQRHVHHAPAQRGRPGGRGGARRLIDIARAVRQRRPRSITSSSPASDNWGKLDKVIALVEAARRAGVRITANMYIYTAGATGLDAAMPPWVQDGGLEAWIERLRDPADPRARHRRDARPSACLGEPARARRLADKVLLLGFKNPKLEASDRQDAGSVAEERGSVARGYRHRPGDRGRHPRRHGLLPDVGRERAAPGRAALDELRLRRAGHGARGSVPAVESTSARLRQLCPAAGPLRARRESHHAGGRRASPERAAGAESRRRGPRPAEGRLLRRRRGVRSAKIQDHATFEKPHQFSTGVSQVLVNGELSLKAGVPTGATAGRFVHGRAWTGRDGGGCRTSSLDWPKHEFHPEHPLTVAQNLPREMLIYR